MSGAGPVGLVGLGLMGTAMAGRLLAAGFEVHGFAPRREVTEAHAARGGIACASVAEVARRCPVVLLSLPDGATTRAVCLGDGGISEAAAPGTVVVDTTTTDPDDAVAVATALADWGIAFFDAGLSGSSTAVESGDVLAVLGGVAQDLPPARRVLDAFCARVVLVGGPGDGMRAKLVINQVHALNRLALAEGLVLAELMGMDLDRMLEVLAGSAAASKATDTWGARMAAGRHHPPQSRVRTGLKDADLIAALGRRHNAPMPALSQYVQLMQAAVAGGLGDADNSAIIEVLRRMAGFGRLPPPAPR